MISYSAIIVGSIAMAAGGFILAAGALWLAATWTGKLAWRLWDNLGDIYKLSAMKYWFNVMQKNGTHALRKGYEDQAAANAAEAQEAAE